MASPFSASPGPEVLVQASLPAKEAPMADADTRNLILGLKSNGSQMLALGNLLQDLGGRGNGIGSQEELQSRLLSSSQQAPGSGLVAGNVPEQALLPFHRIHMESGGKCLDGLRVIITLVKYRNVGFHQSRVCS